MAGNPTSWTYGFAAVVFLTFAIRLATRWRGGARARMLLFASVASVLWASLVVAAYSAGGEALWSMARLADAARLASWLGFVWLLLYDDRWWTTGRAFLALVTALLAASASLAQPPVWSLAEGQASPSGAFGASLAVSVLGLALSEQLYRRTPEKRRWAVKPLVVGVGAMLVFDLVMYTDALLFRRVDPAMWAARAVACALVTPFIAVATARNTAWTIDLHVSRGVVAHSTAIVAAGGYLLIVAAAAYWARLVGGGWGEALQIALVFTALLALAALAFSGTLRARLRVFVSKHFYSYRYDYRREWLQLTNMLGTATQKQELYEQVLRALANLVESLGGSLWLYRDGAYAQAVRLASPEVRSSERDASALPTFLARTGWVVRIDELRQLPGRYDGLRLPSWLEDDKEAWLVVPLSAASGLVGFAVLLRPRAPVDVNWEVLDVLKTAGRQAATFIAQLHASEALLEGEKFDAFNRMSAFVVHDLKNLVAQLSLLLRNAERHRNKPEFQSDMLATVEHVAERMNRLMLQLHSGTRPGEKPRPVDLNAVIAHVVRLYPGRPIAVEVATRAPLRVLAHDDRLERVLRHLVQNALDASDPSAGRVALRARPESGEALVEVADNGVGMTAQFVRDRLFRPFQTTKPQGLGIGMNESLRYVNEIGGRIAVDTGAGRGTTVRVHLPLAAEASVRSPEAAERRA